MAGAPITIKGETIPLEHANFDLDDAAIECRHSERLAMAFTGWMPVEIQLNLPPCKMPISLRVIDVESLQESQMMIIELDGAVQLPNVIA